MLFKLKAILSLHASNFLDRANHENAKTNWPATEKNKQRQNNTKRRKGVKLINLR